ncbi:MAG: LysE family translocator [candidate division Zixibacteria bacterium]|nr:LysE family translocator [candidate division Zixibacteria bacterium]
MFDSSQLLLFMTATLLLNITPGPDMLYVATRSISQGKIAGTVSALGIGGGCVVHCLAAAFGLSALFMYSATAFDVIKYIGAGYLIYLGIRALTAKQSAPSSGVRYAKAPLSQIFWQGVLTNILNPKVALFFLAFLPQFTHSDSTSPALEILILGTIFNISGTIVNIIVALVFGLAGQRLVQKPSFWQFQRWITSAVFIGLGAKLLFTDRR